MVASAPAEAAAGFRLFAAGLPVQPSARMLSTAPGPSWRVLHGFGQATLRALLRALAPILRGGCRVTTLSSTDRGCATVVSGFVTKRPTHASRQHALWLHLPTTLLSITLETTLTTSLAHSLRSPLRALAPDRKGVHIFQRPSFANRHPSMMVKRTHQKEQRSFD